MSGLVQRATSIRCGDHDMRSPCTRIYLRASPTAWVVLCSAILCGSVPSMLSIFSVLLVFLPRFWVYLPCISFLLYILGLPSYFSLYSGSIFLFCHVFWVYLPVLPFFLCLSSFTIVFFFCRWFRIVFLICSHLLFCHCFFYYLFLSTPSSSPMYYHNFFCFSIRVSHHASFCFIAWRIILSVIVVTSWRCVLQARFPGMRWVVFRNQTHIIPKQS